jgi:hypothetical protein
MRENGQHDNGHIIPLLMGNEPLGMKWQMTVLKAYGGVTWRQVIGGKVAGGAGHEWEE